MDAIIVCDEAGAIVDMNEAARRLFGYTREQALGRRALDLYFPEGNHDELRAGPLRVFDNGRRPAPEERLFETLGTDASGRVFPVEVSMDRTDDDAEVIYVAHIRDISHRKAAEEDLTEARDKALAGERAKAEFLALMSHEMRTPLNGLLGTMQLMRDHSLTERQTDLLDHMQSSGRLLLGLVNDVLDLEKFEAGKLTAESRPFSVSRLLDAVVETTAALATQGGNEIAWSWLGPEDRVLGDTRRLRQVLLNLVGNAIKFTRAGSIDIEVERLGGAGETVEFRVVDTGVGIAPEHLERIFNDFETLDSSYARRAGGTGLGLGIARRLVGLMGGTIGVESEPGAGSLFWIRVPLPRVDQVPSGADAPAALVTETAAGEPLEVLLVEDNEINRFVARAMLESDGHVVTEAVNGQAGVEWAEARAFDVILMDVSMPVMDGQEATRRIRAGAGPSAATPIIAVTAHALPEEVARFREAGMDDCISKPIDRAALVTLLRGIRGAEANEEEPVRDDASPVLDEAQLADLLETLGPEATGRLGFGHRLGRGGAQLSQVDALLLMIGAQRLKRAVDIDRRIPAGGADQCDDPLRLAQGIGTDHMRPVREGAQRCHQLADLADVGDAAVVAGDGVARQQVGVVVVPVCAGAHLFDLAFDHHRVAGERIAREQCGRSVGAGGAGAADAVGVNHGLHVARAIGHLAHHLSDGGGGVAAGGLRQVREVERDPRRAERAGFHQLVLEALPGGDVDLVARHQHHVLEAAPLDRAAQVERVVGPRAGDAHGGEVGIGADAACAAQRHREVAPLGRGPDRGLPPVVHGVARNAADIHALRFEDGAGHTDARRGEIHHQERNLGRVGIVASRNQRAADRCLDLIG